MIELQDTFSVVFRLRYQVVVADFQQAVPVPLAGFCFGATAIAARRWPVLPMPSPFTSRRISVERAPFRCSPFRRKERF